MENESEDGYIDVTIMYGLVQIIYTVVIILVGTMKEMIIVIHFGQKDNATIIKAKTVTAMMDGIGKCSKYRLLSGIVINHIAIDYKGQICFVLLCFTLFYVALLCFCCVLCVYDTRYMIHNIF